MRQQKQPWSLRDYVLLITLFLVSFLIYWPGLSGGFIFDDFGNLIDNPAFAPNKLHVHFWSSLWSSNSGPTDRPLSMLTFAIQDLFSGLAPWPLKLVNVMIHLANGLLIFLLSRGLFDFILRDRYVRDAGTFNQSWLISPNTLALLITAAWMVAPIQLTAVLYVIQRMESLSALFVLIGLLLYWQGRLRLLHGLDGGWWRILTGLIGGTILAVLAKETGVMLPLYAFLLEWLILRGRTAHGFDIRLTWLYLMLLIIPGITGILYTLPSALSGHAYIGRPFDLAERLWTEGRVLIDYLLWIILPPDTLSLYHDDITLSTGWFAPWTTATSWVTIFLLIGVALWLKDRVPLFSFGVLWFFAGHTLVSTYLPLEIAYEHRNYLPSWGIFIALFGIVVTWAPKDIRRFDIMRTLTIGSITALIALYASLTVLRAQTWGNPYRLAYFEATTHPDSPRASYDLARIMMISASSTHSPLFQMGLVQMRKTARLDNAGLQPDQGLIFMAAKNRMAIDPAWWSSLRSKITARPLSAEDIGALYSLITCQINDVCSYSQNDILQLGESLHLATTRYPKDASVITLYANYSANITHNFPLAYQLMQEAVALNPLQFDYWKNLVTLQIAAGQLSDAQTGIKRMRELNSQGTHDTAIATMQSTLQEKELTHQPSRESIN